MAEVNEEARNILNRQLHGLPNDGINRKTSVFSFATGTEIAILVLSSLCAIAAGVLFPIMTVIYGQLVSGFNGFTAGTTTESKLRSTISQFSLFYVYLAVAVFILIYASTVGFYYTGEKMARSLRHEYLKSVLRQNIAFFDVLGTGEVSTRIMSDMGVIQEGISHKLSLAITAIATFCSALVISFVMYWKTALIMSPTYIVMLIIGTIAGRQAIKFLKDSRNYKSNGASIAEETVTSVRQVAAFGMANFLADKYDSYLKDGEVSGIKSRNSFAAYAAWCNAMPSLVYGLSFWAGSIYLVKGEISVAGVTTTALTISVGAFAIVRVAPCFEALFASITSADAVLKTIAIKSPQDPFETSGTRLDDLKGDISFQNVSLIYPSRDDITVLDKVQFDVPAARTTAIVGSSGCGKSSIIALLERFYEPISGQITMDGHDIQTFNLGWLRSKISLVGQEPTLFSTTIFENIRHGLVNSDTELSMEEIEERVVAAAKKANAHDFIQDLPLAYQTQVGQKGLQLSGGQRQRISIARALINDPKILLLDEATSALDTKSEAAVQRALESAAVGRTTIIVAHRLSTIQKADNIIVMAEGRVVEQGKHEKLMSLGGVYAGFVQKQQLGSQGHNDALDPQELAVHQPHKSEQDDVKVINEKAFDPEKGSAHSLDAVAGVSDSSQTEQTSKVSLWDTLAFITHLNKPEWKYLLFGLITAILAGAVVPVQSVFFAKLLAAFAYPKSEYGLLRHTVNSWAGYYVILAAIAFVTYMCQGLCFAYSTERLLHRAKDKCLRAILRQDISFFDEEEHSPGNLTSLLHSSTEDLTALSGVLIGSILTFISTIVTGLVVSIVIGWKLALVCTATIPLVVACGWVRLQVLVVFDEQIRQSGKDSAAYASEAVSAMRTVASLGLENHVLVAYDEILAKQAGNFIRSILSASALYAASQSAALLASALAFWYGGGLIASREYTVFQFYICFVTLVIGSQIAGAVFSYAPDASKAMYATQELKKMFNRQPRIKNNASEGLRIGKSATGGKIEIQNVNFRYPARPDRLILDNFNLNVMPGQYIAFVGPSGCGKSTILGLLERFYDPNSGQIKVDGQEISDLNITDYRNLVSLVSQETTLYTGTIKENIVMGLDDGISDDDIARACKLANIYSFIESLSEGFSTFVGARGSMLSGGQRQRIAIARALLRNPVILLLDEATSALDTESEKVVQDALDAAAKDRTTIAIAHRLSTIKKADKIFVLDQGRIVQVGTHSELIAVKGMYLDLVNMQSFQ